MNTNLFETLGIIGNVLLVASYFPQYIKIIETKQAEDISIGMLLIIMLGDLLLITYALSRSDMIVSGLFIIFIIENLFMIFLANKYKKHNLKTHTEKLNPRDDIHS